MKVAHRLLGVVVFGLASLQMSPAFSQVGDKPSAPPEELEKNLESAPAAPAGLAAFYHAAFQGRRTASGELFDHKALTAAHKTLPFGTLVRVINLRNNKSVVVRVNDRGPMQADRVIDVTHRAATLLGFLQQGMTEVALEILPRGAAGYHRSR